MIPSDLPPRPSEAILLAALDELRGERLLCTSLGRGQLASAAARAWPESRVVCHFLDIYLADKARGHYRDGPANLSIVCQSDLPGDEIDVAAFPFTSQGNAELTRELMQQGHQALAVGGRMLASTNNRRDTWLGGEMRKLSADVSRRELDQGVLYAATKTGPLRKLKNFTGEFVFRDRQRLLRAVSRPGVFSHRRVDLGARALMAVMEISPGQRVFDMGCGSGVLALAAAARAPGVQVFAVDSNPRAVECTLRGAALNELSSISARLDAQGTCDAPGTFDLFLANPPYYSDFRIAEIFLDAGRRALAPGGRIHVVTKQLDWYLETLPTRFEEVEVHQLKDYFVVTARQP